MYSFDWYSSFYPIYCPLGNRIANKNRVRGDFAYQTKSEVICQQSNPLPDADSQKIYATWLTTIFSLVCNNISIKLLELLCSLYGFTAETVGMQS